ncbi:bifunctional helix-turn-helix transcriptional regulator/GNAT family N-acetyltransferase [Pectinatus frisingensis]|uniref:bifunctional helix-turn-helix transcriptional regulator/GNAT family N-acetyltransferase n=1 Tax=Pectinatus frisingensis TaxID=865 RepID=UPI001E34C19E|nr:bifunctional helix-turn-helix transcriptional regulator/GNAT family N-acetyltransferase [Pectinatus frisingensis]
MREIGAISRCIQTINDSKLKQLNLERGQFVFLTRICENKGINPIDLSIMLKVDKSTTTKAIRKMEDKGLIERKQDNIDKRMWRLYPKSEALNLYSLIIGEENENISICFSDFTENEKSLACEFIKKMEKNIGQKWKNLKNEPLLLNNTKGEDVMTSLKICEYTSIYRREIIDMILKIQRDEFKLPISIKDQPDLEDIDNFYQKRGEFWVAINENEVIGSIGIIDIGNGNAVLRKMFVKEEYRGKDKGISAKLLTQLLKWAAQNNFCRIFLGTTLQFLAAHRFYEKNQFVEISKDELPNNFPIMEVDKKFYRYDVK